MVDAIFSNKIIGSLIAQAHASPNSFMNNPAIILMMFIADIFCCYKTCYYSLVICNTSAPRISSSFLYT